MRILVVCDEGNNRSVTIAQHLKYWDHDVLTVGLNRNTQETLTTLCNWADRIIITAADQHNRLWAGFSGRVQLWDVGPDTYPRPFNPTLKDKVRVLMEQHRAEYKPGG